MNTNFIFDDTFFAHKRLRLRISVDTHCLQIIAIIHAFKTIYKRSSHQSNLSRIFSYIFICIYFSYFQVKENFYL